MMAKRKEDPRTIVRLTQEALAKHLHEVIKDRLMKQLVDDFKANAEPIVKAEVEKVTLEGVDRMADLRGLRDELNVHMRWHDEEA